MKSYAETINHPTFDWRWNLLRETKTDHKERWTLMKKLCVDWLTSPSAQLNVLIPRKEEGDDKGMPDDVLLRRLDMLFCHAIWKHDVELAIIRLDEIEHRAAEIVHQEKCKKSFMYWATSYIFNQKSA